MQTKAIIIPLVGLAMSVHAETNTARRPLTPEQRAERRAEMHRKREARIAAEGGYVTKQPQGNCVRIVTAQKKVSADTIRELVKQFNSGLRIWVEVTEIEPAGDVWATLEKARSIPNTGLLTLVVEDDKLPRILSALEEGWSILNVKGLEDDLPPRDVYDNRVRKELNRAFAMSAGAGLTLNKPCVMEPVFTITDLDNIKFPVISPEVFSKITDVGFKRKIDRMITKTYKAACREGWAPPPTNDVQRTIWNQVHQIPDKPITIEFDPKKDK